MILGLQHGETVGAQVPRLYFTGGVSTGCSDCLNHTLDCLQQTKHTFTQIYGFPHVQTDEQGIL